MAENNPTLTCAERADNARARMTALYEEIKPTLTTYQQYGESVRALSVEYVKASLEAAFPGVLIHSGVVFTTVDAAHTPKTNDRVIAECDNAIPKLIVQDLKTGKFHILV